jgi:hypothetical protein
MVTSLPSGPPHNSPQELWFQFSVASFQEVIDHVMRTYGMMVNLTPEEEQSAPLRLTVFLKEKNVEGTKLLRGGRPLRARHAKY